MSQKARKYLNYIVKFSKSPNKRAIVKELTAEVKNKGFVHGIRSLLHKKVHAKGTYYHQAHAKWLVVKKFDQTKVVLPAHTNPLVSIIIPMYNQLDHTLDCINAIYEHNDFKDYEIIIADDNSTENTSAIKTYFENIVVVRNPVNLGFLKNCNNAATHAKGSYLVFLNNDTQVQQDWLAELLLVFQNYADAGLVGSKLVYPDGRLQEAGGIIWKDGSGWNYGNQDDPGKPEYNYVKEADYISGASVMISRKLWDELGGFDELFSPAYCEDSDLCFRVRKSGYKVYLQPFSVVVHFEGVSHGKNVNKGIKAYQVTNQKKLAERWHDELQKKSENGVNVFSERDRTGGKKHVMVIDHYLPTVDKDAGSRTISNFMDVLQELGYSVKFLGENQNSSLHYQKMFQEKGVEVLYGADYNFYDQSWKNYLKANMNKFDAFLLSRSSVCTPVMAFLRTSNYRGNIIYYGHDLGYRRMEQEAAAKKDEAMMKHARRIKAAEDFMYQNADNALYISQEEAEYLRKYVTRPLHYVPPYFFKVEADTAPLDKRDGLLFVGGFNHPPNKEAVIWFLDEVYGPLYRLGVGLTIAGSKMPKEIYEYKSRYTTLCVLTDVPIDELNDLYKKARIAVVPLRSGAGVKGKVIEAMAKGVPIVGTDVAFEGMPKDEHYMYKGVNDPQQMADAIRELHGDEQLWNRLAEYGKRYVAAHYNRENMKEVFRKLIG